MGLCNFIVLIFHRLGYQQLAWTCEIAIGARKNRAGTGANPLSFVPCLRTERLKLAMEVKAGSS